jgi:hypothetical protein
MLKVPPNCENSAATFCKSLHTLVDGFGALNVGKEELADSYFLAGVQKIRSVFLLGLLWNPRYVTLQSGWLCLSAIGLPPAVCPTLSGCSQAKYLT